MVLGNLRFVEFKDMFIGLFGFKLGDSDFEYYFIKVFEFYINDIF